MRVLLELALDLKGFRALFRTLRALPGVNTAVTQTIRWVGRLLGVTPEFALWHLRYRGQIKVTLPDRTRARLFSSGEDWLTNVLFWRGLQGWEPEVTSLFWQLASKAGLTLDIGAHIGFYSVLAAFANPTGVVYAFEPVPEVFERLRHNLALNRLSNVVAFQQAVGATDGQAELLREGGPLPVRSSLSAAYARTLTDTDVQRLGVRMVSIDTVAKAHGLGRVDLVKMDTETTEPDVLKGMREVLHANRPKIICEVLPSADVDALMAILEPLHYRFYLLTDVGPRCKDAIAPDTTWPNYLFSVDLADG